MSLRIPLKRHLRLQNIKENCGRFCCILNYLKNFPIKSKQVIKNLFCYFEITTFNFLFIQCVDSTYFLFILIDDFNKYSKTTLLLLTQRTSKIFDKEKVLKSSI